MSNDSRKIAPNGEIINLMQVTTVAAETYIGILLGLLTYFIDIVMNLYFMWTYLGVAAFISYGAMIMVTPINIICALLQYKTEAQLLAKKDARVKVFNDVLNGIKVIKFYGWEISFEKLVEKFRNIELNTLKKRSFIYAIYNLSSSLNQIGFTSFVVIISILVTIIYLFYLFLF